MLLRLICKDFFSQYYLRKNLNKTILKTANDAQSILAAMKQRRAESEDSKKNYIPKNRLGLNK